MNYLVPKIRTMGPQDKDNGDGRSAYSSQTVLCSFLETMIMNEYLDRTSGVNQDNTRRVFQIEIKIKKVSAGLP